MHYGSFTGVKLLAGRGPGVNIVISSIGNVETDLRSEFTSKGINQTLHRVYLQVDCEVSILTPFKDLDKKISNQVLLLENGADVPPSGRGQPADRGSVPERV